MRRFFNSQKLYSLILLTLVALATSCTSSKEIIYFQDEPISSSAENIAVNTDIIYKSNDLLTITVSGDPDAVKPFNLQAISYDISQIDVQGSPRLQTYLIDREGHIEFPVLGTLKLAGLSRTEATNLIKQRLLEYIKEPIVNIRLINFTFTVLGAVNNPGAFTIEDEKVSVLEAIGHAGDLTIHGKRDNVFLIREENGKKRFTKFDLTSINVVNPPNYYLRQDDVIYVEPNQARIRSASYNQNNGIIISAIGTLATIIAILIK